MSKCLTENNNPEWCFFTDCKTCEYWTKDSIHGEEGKLARHLPEAEGSKATEAHDSLLAEVPSGGLKPCPFCGGTNIHQVSHTGNYLHCLDCCAHGPSSGNDYDGATIKWNTRT